jgi:hypothetical protein
MSTIQVDLDGLALLAARLADVRTRLAADAGSDLAGRCPDALVSAALQDVQQDWSRKRKLICGYLDAVSSAVRQAAVAYTTVESEVGRAAVIGGGGR